MIKWVVDGDTLVLDNELRIRLQGIDAPETKQQCADLFDGEKKYFPCGEIATMRLAQIIGSAGHATVARKPGAQVGKVGRQRI